MAIILNSEYGNVNARRKYPFADTASLLDGDGLALPLDFIVDACLYPIDIAGLLYLASVNADTHTAYFADTATGAVVAQAVYAPGTVPVYETGPYARQIGVLVCGSGTQDMFRGRVVRDFDAAATVLAPAACTPLRQAGVRGIALPDGTLVTGAVTIEGRDGITVRTFRDGDQNVLVVDAEGTQPPDLQECGVVLGPAICSIKVVQKAGSKIIAWQYDDTTIGLALFNTSLDGLCAAARDLRRPPDPGDPTPCDPQDPAAEEESAAAEFTLTLCGMNGNLNIVAPSSPGYVNPILVQPLPTPVQGASVLAVAPHTDVSGVVAAVDRFAKPPATAGGIRITISGLSQKP